MPPSSETLRAFLEHPGRPAGTLPLEELRGFLFAIVNAPELIVPSRWMPKVFGGEEACVAGLEDARGITAALMEEYNAINEASMAAESRLPPGCVFGETPIDNLDDDAAIARWSRGFRAGYLWVQDTWQQYLPDSDSDLDRRFSMALVVLSFFSSRQIAEALCAETHAQDLPAIAGTMMRTFPGAVRDYVRIGRRLQTPAAEARQAPRRRAAPKTGRNEPCRCGSGRKYKRCCGAPN